MNRLTFKLNEKLYLRDPQSSDLGRKIIKESITLIDKLGFEEFTFKKLGDKIESTETSIYRYFENKHRILLYLTAWYWNWIEYRIDKYTHPTQKPEEKIKWSIKVLTEEKKFDNDFDFVNEEALYRIVLFEQDKTYLTKRVDKHNHDGLFASYKSTCKKIADFIQEYNPKYPFPNALVSTAIIAVHQQIFFAQHLPSLTNLKGKFHIDLQSFIENLIFKTIKK